MRRGSLAFLIVAATGACTAASMAACSSSNGGNGTGSGSDASTQGDAPAGDAGPALFVPEITCTDSIDSVYADPGDVSAKPKGAILKCAKDSDLTAAQMTAAVAVTDGGNVAYSGKAFTSGAHVYRVLYRTERGDDNDAGVGSPGYSSALLLLPDHPRLGASTQLPVVVAAHGSFGQAGKCAPSRSDPATDYVREDFQHLVYPMVGLGYPVIAPDFAGYANFGGAPPPTYSHASDVGKSVLDGARAIRNVIPSSVTESTILTGHSQGGFSTLAALSMADRYGGAGTGVIAGVALYAPLWFSQHAYGAVFFAPTSYPLASSKLGAISIWYHYTESYLLDGPDAALDLFDPAKASVVQSFVDNDCWAASFPDLLEAGTSANDFFSKTYQSAITSAALPKPLGTGGDCGDGGNAALCQKWLDRMTADYPHLTGGAAKVPILLYYANDDQTITSDAMQCVFNRLTGDQADYQVCYDTDPIGHTGVVAVNSSYVADWIAWKTLPEAGAPAKGHCSSLGVTDAGVPQLLLPNGSPQECNPLLSTE